MPSPAPSHDTTPASLRACVQWRGLPLPHAMSRPELSWPQGMPPPAPKPGAQPKACHCVVRPSPPNLRHAATRPSCLLTPLWEGVGRGVTRRCFVGTGGWGVGRAHQCVPVVPYSGQQQQWEPEAPLWGPGPRGPVISARHPFGRSQHALFAWGARGGHAGRYILCGLGGKQAPQTSPIRRHCGHARRCNTCATRTTPRRDLVARGAY